MIFLMPFFFLLVDSCLGSFEPVEEDVPDWPSVEDAAVEELCPEVLSGAGALALWPVDDPEGADELPLSGAVAAGGAAVGAGVEAPEVSVGGLGAEAGGAPGVALAAGAEAGAAPELAALPEAGGAEVGASMICAAAVVPMGVAPERDEAPPPVRASTCVVGSVSAFAAAEPFMLNVGPGALGSNTVEAETV